MKGMSLQDLVASHRATHEPVGSGLHSLVRPEVAAVVEPPAKRMNLVQALNARDRGEIVQPTGGDGLGSMVAMDAELPPSRPPPPRRSTVLDEIHAEAVANAEMVRVEKWHTPSRPSGRAVSSVDEQGSREHVWENNRATGNAQIPDGGFRKLDHQRTQNPTPVRDRKIG
jgi:hypothetical protein